MRRLAPLTSTLCLLACACSSAGPAAPAALDAVGEDATPRAEVAGSPDVLWQPEAGPEVEVDAAAALDAGPDAGPDVAVEPELPVPVEPFPPYGARSVEVPATTYWVMTELHLEPGDTFSVSATGAWTSWEEADPLHGPAGHADYLWDGCAIGSLVARVGLEASSPKVCVGAGGEWTAERAGLLYLAMNDGVREDNDGALQVEVASAAAWAPALAAAEVADFPLEAVQSPWVEVVGQHVVWALPLELVAAHRDTAEASLAAFDAWYEAHAALAAATPYGGQRVRYYPDLGVEQWGAWMVAGNPILVHPDALDSPPGGESALRSHDPAHSVWGFVHELGHDFTFVNGGRYLIGYGPTEAWANVFTLHTLAASDHPEQDKSYCDGRAGYLADGWYFQFEKDPWVPLCMLMELRDAHGWGLYEGFFAWYNALDLEAAGVPAPDAPVGERWAWLRDALSAVAGEDLTPVFAKYKVPLEP